MKEKTLFKIAFISSLIGLFILYLVADNLEIEETTIDKIDEKELDETVKIKGIITYLKEDSKIMFLKVSRPDSVDVIVFKDGFVSLKKGDYVSINGEIKEYKGKKEIIAGKIERLDI